VTAEEYVRQVDFRLRDLPWKTRRELVSELRAHLSELPADELASLGTPEQYASDLRSAAGLERRRGPIAFLLARRPRNLVLTVVALAVIGSQSAPSPGSTATSRSRRGTPRMGRSTRTSLPRATASTSPSTRESRSATA